MDIACDHFLREVSAPFLPDLSPLDEGRKVVELSGAGETVPLAKVIPIVSKQMDSILAPTQNVYVNVSIFHFLLLLGSKGCENKVNFAAVFQIGNFEE